MSSDNYILVRKRSGGGYYVSDESASIPRPTTFTHGRRFGTFDEAMAYAETLYSEYGIECDFETRVVEA